MFSTGHYCLIPVQVRLLYDFNNYYYSVSIIAFSKVLRGMRMEIEKEKFSLKTNEAGTEV